MARPRSLQIAYRLLRGMHQRVFEPCRTGIFPPLREHLVQRVHRVTTPVPGEPEMSSCPQTSGGFCWLVARRIPCQNPSHGILGQYLELLLAHTWLKPCRCPSPPQQHIFLRVDKINH
jgi:hypothetical protein